MNWLGTSSTCIPMIRSSLILRGDMKLSSRLCHIIATPPFGVGCKRTCSPSLLHDTTELYIASMQLMKCTLLWFNQCSDMPAMSTDLEERSSHKYELLDIRPVTFHVEILRFTVDLSVIISQYRTRGRFEQRYVFPNHSHRTPG